MNEKLLENPELAYVVAAITGDGHLQINKWRHLVSFYSKEIEEIEKMKKLFDYLFQVDGRLYPDNRKYLRYRLFFISKPVALFLREIRTPVGNKTNIVFTIPEWVKNGSDLTKGAYLQGIFDSEGSVFCRNTLKPRWQISIDMAKNESIIDSGINYMNEVRKLLTDFNINCSPVTKSFLNLRKDGSKSFQMKFSIELLSFGNFYKYVGFRQTKKQEKLLFALEYSARRQEAKAIACKSSRMSLHRQ